MTRHSTLHDWLAWQETLHPTPIALGLDRVRAVAGMLDLLHPPYPLITVAGTNGKGSTVALLEALYHAAGYRVGTYTSPHLLRYNERVRIHRAEIDDAALCAAFARIDTARGNTSLTYFEFGTLAALEIFSRHPLDIVILEVGLGGRLDAVNVWDADVALITSIGLDHTAWLGTTREAIGREKAGIFRPGKPAVYSERDIPNSVLDHARAEGTTLYRYGLDYNYTPASTTWAWRSATRARHALPYPALRGAFQLQNAAGALMAIELLHDILPLDQEAVRRGLGEVALAGRFQVLPGAPCVILDVAHNPHGSAVLAQSLREHPCPGHTHAVFAMLEDKDIPGVVETLAKQIDTWHIAPLPTTRAAPIEQLRSALSGHVTHEYSDIPHALHGARTQALPNDRIVVFGSFHTVAAAWGAI